MGKDQVIINDGGSGGTNTIASIGSFSIGGNGDNDVKKIKIGDKWAHMINYNGTMIWNDFRLDDLPVRSDVWGSSKESFGAKCGACFGAAIRILPQKNDTSPQGIKMTYTLPYNSITHTWTVALSFNYDIEDDSPEIGTYSLQVFLNNNSTPKYTGKGSFVSNKNTWLRLLIASPFHDGPSSSFCLYFDCGRIYKDGKYTVLSYYFATNDKGERYKYNSPNTYIKKTNDDDCRPHLEAISKPGYIYTGPSTEKQAIVLAGNYDYDFWARRWYTEDDPYWEV